MVPPLNEFAGATKDLRSSFTSRSVVQVLPESSEYCSSVRVAVDPVSLAMLQVIEMLLSPASVALTGDTGAA